MVKNSDVSEKLHTPASLIADQMQDFSEAQKQNYEDHGSRCRK